MTRWTGTGAHRTRTIASYAGERYKTKSNGSAGRYVTVWVAKAECVCEWSYNASDRPEAQAVARVHRRTLSVPTADLRALADTMSEACIPFELGPALRRLWSVLDEAGSTETAEPAVVDLRPILRHANRPYLYAEHSWLPQLVQAFDAAYQWEPVGMIDSARGWCDYLAAAHGLSLDEWLKRVTPATV
ncbi:hypothetical protein IU485_27865 [Nocardia cyriacigeorgica]|uniref:hypothetical protein n=1 Tax=Nocardia cyriacigeorgica TaxID=135487 RepID=UPI00189571D2|nr:hypothetical protein [Nocardia cyriacigeorgica]MBF6085195.1 hypothetical protein [Nocardia cyriacigeorgica]